MFFLLGVIKLFESYFKACRFLFRVLRGYSCLQKANNNDTRKKKNVSYFVVAFVILELSSHISTSLLMVLVHDICWRKCREPRILVNRLLEKVPAFQSKTELRCKTHKMNCIKFRLYLRYICNYN